MAAELGIPTVLVVDDEPLVAQLLQDTLEEGGFEVVLANGYDAAVAALESRPGGFAGLVTDINLHDKQTGWDVATRARELMPLLPVVYVTGDSAHVWPAQGVPQSVVVPKPFAPAQITVALVGLITTADAAKLPQQN